MIVSPESDLHKIVVRVIAALNVIQHGVYPKDYTKQLEDDVEFIKSKYDSTKWVDGDFMKSMDNAKAEYMERLLRDV